MKVLNKVSTTLAIVTSTVFFNQFTVTSSPDPSSRPFGTAPKSWCLSVIEGLQFEQENFGTDSQSTRASFEEGNCGYWGLSLPGSNSSPSSTSSPDPSSRPFGTAPKSWCLSVIEGLQFEQENFGTDSQSTRASFEEGNCGYWGLSLPGSNSSPSSTSNPEYEESEKECEQVENPPNRFPTYCK